MDEILPLYRHSIHSCNILVSYDYYFGKLFPIIEDKNKLVYPCSYSKMLFIINFVNESSGSMYSFKS